MARNEENTLSRATGLSTRWCPSCSKTGRQVKLKLCQINLEEAMYLCTKEKVKIIQSQAWSSQRKSLNLNLCYYQ